jgi:hypothetical protein
VKTNGVFKTPPDDLKTFLFCFSAFFVIVYKRRTFYHHFEWQRNMLFYGFFLCQLFVTQTASGCRFHQYFRRGFFAGSFLYLDFRFLLILAQGYWLKSCSKNV